MKIVIVFHSGFGHTKMVAERIAKGAKSILPDVQLFSIEEAMQASHALQEADTIVFGSPTYFGNVSADFKRFMESTGNIWAQQRWKNKLAAGFTNSSSTNGDKLSTLISLSIFAAQHSMMWIPLGILPKYDEGGNQIAEHNGMASYLGLMTLSSNAYQFKEPTELSTAELFGQRIAEVTKQVMSNRLELIPA
jgi:NAD(P)H dehydrogenase (quinone)